MRVLVSGRAGAELTVSVVTEAAPAISPVERGSGTGLIGFRERLDLVSGTLDHGATSDGGHRLTARIPWRAGNEAR